MLIFIFIFIHYEIITIKEYVNMFIILWISIILIFTLFILIYILGDYLLILRGNVKEWILLRTIGI